MIGWSLDDHSGNHISRISWTTSVYYLRVVRNVRWYEEAIKLGNIIMSQTARSLLGIMVERMGYKVKYINSDMSGWGACKAKGPVTVNISHESKSEYKYTISIRDDNSDDETPLPETLLPSHLNDLASQECVYTNEPDKALMELERLEFEFNL